MCSYLHKIFILAKSGCYKKLDLPEGRHSAGVGGQMRNLLYTLPGLLHNWSSYLLLGFNT
jgi:hypothetical protein